MQEVDPIDPGVLTETAVAEAIRLRLDQVRASQGEDEAWYEDLRAIADDVAAHLPEPYRSIEVDAFLYDEDGLPR